MQMLHLHFSGVLGLGAATKVGIGVTTGSFATYLSTFWKKSPQNESNNGDDTSDNGDKHIYDNGEHEE